MYLPKKVLTVSRNQRERNVKFLTQNFLYCKYSSLIFIYHITSILDSIISDILMQMSFI